MVRNPYRHRVALRNSVVVFLDILGFSSRVRKATVDGVSDQLLIDLQTTLHKAMTHLKAIDVAPHDDLHATHVFTDNVVVGIPLLDPMAKGEDEIGDAFTALPGYQLEMALGSFFARGGLTINHHYMYDDTVFGPGVVEATQLEASADVPRIVLGPIARRYVLRQMKFYSSVNDSPHNDVILIDGDGRWFINYLSETGPLWDAEPDLEPLDIHARLISHNLHNEAHSSKVRAKYVWLANYHNWFCEQYGVDGRYRVPDALLPSDNAYLPPRRLSELLIMMPIGYWNELSPRQQRKLMKLGVGFVSRRWKPVRTSKKS